MFVKRYAAFDVDHIAGLDARGFVLGAPIALALRKVVYYSFVFVNILIVILFGRQPFIMVRKQGKLPNSITGAEYYKEYKGASAGGGDSFCISRGACRPGDKILIIDDLIATGVSLPTIN